MDQIDPQLDSGKEQPSSQNGQGQQTLAQTVPERPARAHDVRLIGELRESAFKDRQWLIQRDGQFIQLTELLYRVIEQVDGKRTLEEIAAKVTESTDWIVSADNVRQLIQAKLIPIGLIAVANSASVPYAENRGRSPLMLKMRTRVISPDIINPIYY